MLHIDISIILQLFEKVHNPRKCAGLFPLKIMYFQLSPLSLNWFIFCFMSSRFRYLHACLFESFQLFLSQRDLQSLLRIAKWGPLLSQQFSYQRVEATFIPSKPWLPALSLTSCPRLTLLSMDETVLISGGPQEEIYQVNGLLHIAHQLVSLSKINSCLICFFIISCGFYLFTLKVLFNWTEWTSRTWLG